MTEEKKFTINEAHKEFAKETNGRIWALLDKEKRSQIENDELLYVAYASCYHWFKVGTGVHHQRGEYLISKVYISLHISEQALHHAKRCLDLTEQHRNEMKDFDIAFAYECVARAYAMHGDEKEAIKYYDMAKTAGNKIKDTEDKQIFDSDMESGNWFGIG